MQPQCESRAEKRKQTRQNKQHALEMKTDILPIFFQFFNGRNEKETIKDSSHVYKEEIQDKTKAQNAWGEDARIFTKINKANRYNKKTHKEPPSHQPRSSPIQVQFLAETKTKTKPTTRVYICINSQTSPNQIKKSTG